MLRKRIITGFFISLAMTIIVIFSYNRYFISAVCAVLSVLAVRELYHAAGLCKNKAVYYISLLLSAAVSFLPIPVWEYITLAFFAIAIVIFSYLMSQVKRKNKIHPVVTITIAMIITCFFNCASQIRSKENGLFLLAISILTPVITDISAYFLGKKTGKHRLAPSVSPNKTIEGSVGGTLCCVLLLFVTAIIMQQAGFFTIRPVALLIYLFTSSIVSQFGDLSFSAVKRIVSIKDYSNLLPGHGGILDRFDSWLFVLPYTYLLIHI